MQDSQPIGLLKGHMENPISLDKFDIKMRDSEMDIFFHVNSKFSVYDIP